MAITLEANYSKKVGLPGYSSHQFMLTLRTEISDLTQVQNESARLYKQLQDGVDTSLKEIGWLPEPASTHPRNGNGSGHNRAPLREEPWKCSPKQQALILRIVEEQQLDKNAIEQLAQDRFGRGVRQLNKLEASGLIEELFDKNRQRQPAPAR